MTDTPPSVPAMPNDAPLGAVAQLQQNLAAIDATTVQPRFWTMRGERGFWRDTAASIARSRYLGEYLVYLAGRVEALEAEVAALKK